VRNAAHQRYFEKQTQVWLKMLKRATHLGECDAEGRIILKCKVKEEKLSLH
jgi:hypothetical protein